MQRKALMNAHNQARNCSHASPRRRLKPWQFAGILICTAIAGWCLGGGWTSKADARQHVNGVAA